MGWVTASTGSGAVLQAWVVLRMAKLTRAGCCTPQGEEILECSQVILAMGHSARDTFAELHRLGLPMEAKAFSVGGRIEHPAALIDRAQYGLQPAYHGLGRRTTISAT